jgi:peptidoglycan/xylan/chitin deacetylase (PgdA/CDA1 family)
MRRFLSIVLVLLGAAATYAQAPDAELRGPVTPEATPAPPPHDGHELAAILPPAGFRPSAASAGSYACTPVLAGPNGRCASTDIPGGLSLLNTPQFVLVTWDDCITPETEALVRDVMPASLQNPDKRPLPATYFVSLEGCPGNGGTSSDALIRQRYNAGDEIAVHTKTHTTSATATLQTWRRELQDVKAHFARLGLGADAGKGFRAPYLATNPAMYQALSELGFLYDSSVFEPPFWSPVTRSTLQYVWPFSYDVWDAANPAQFCANWAPTNACPDRPHKGLWQVPLYYYATGTQSNPTYYGAMDIGDPAYSGFSRPIAGESLLYLMRVHGLTRLYGNRAPLTLYFHAESFRDAGRRATYRQFLGEMLQHDDVWVVTMQGLIEWMKNPVPASRMKDWYKDYCKRHVCPAPSSNRGDADLAEDAAATGADAPTAATEAALRVFPSPTRGPVTLQATTTTADAVLTVHDMLGREVHRAVVAAPGAATHHLDLGTYAAGLYLVRLVDGGRATTRTVTVQP